MSAPSGAGAGSTEADWAARFAALASQLDLAVLVEGADGRVAHVSQAHAALFQLGGDARGLAGVDALEVLARGYRIAKAPEARANDARAARSRVASASYEVPLADGRVLVCDVRTVPEGAGAARVWTHRERPARSKPREGADDSNSRLVAILNTSTDAILSVSAQGVIESINPAVERIFGRDAADLLGSDVRALLPGLSLTPDEADVGSYLRGGATDEGTVSRTHLAGVRADGSVFPMDLAVSAVPLRGRVVFTVTVRDTTEQRAAERLKSEFVATVSHEMRTPLTSIRGSLGLLENNVLCEIPAPALELVTIARANTERLIRLINDVLDLEKIEAGKMDLRRADIDARELVHGTLAGMQAYGAQHGVEVRAEVEGAPQLYADRDRLVQVLTNLLSNAVRFSRKGETVLLKVFPVGSPSGPRLRFEVRDAGPGIAREDIPRLFRRFEQLPAAGGRSHGGTGLGLAIARRLVEQHGGTIGVDSEPGRGSTFWFELLAVRETGARGSLLPVPRRTVLVVEDEDSIASALRAHFAREGYRVARVASRVEALARIDSEEPDVLVLDVGLPDGNGLDLLTAVSAGPNPRRIPTIVLSGRDAPSPLPVGAVRWFRKPFDPGALLRCVRHAARPPGPPRVLLAESDAATATALRDALVSDGAHVRWAADGRAADAASRNAEPDLVVLDAALRDMDAFELIDRLRQERTRTAPLVVCSDHPIGIADRQALSLGETTFVVRPLGEIHAVLAAARALLAELLGAQTG